MHAGSAACLTQHAPLPAAQVVLSSIFSHEAAAASAQPWFQSGVCLLVLCAFGLTRFACIYSHVSKSYWPSFTKTWHNAQTTLPTHWLGHAHMKRTRSRPFYLDLGLYPRYKAHRL